MELKKEPPRSEFFFENEKLEDKAFLFFSYLATTPFMDKGNKKSKAEDDSWKLNLFIILEALKPIQKKTLIETVISKGKSIQNKEVQHAVERLRTQKLEPTKRRTLKVLK